MNWILHQHLGTQLLKCLQHACYIRSFGTNPVRMPALGVHDVYPPDEM